VIFVVDQGRIVESGRHDELLRLNGRYRELNATQYAGISSS
jgi:ATP-binding cassette subfamily B (MDR/TAP) protein 1